MVLCHTCWDKMEMIGQRLAWRNQETPSWGCGRVLHNNSRLIPSIYCMVISLNQFVIDGGRRRECYCS